MSVKNASAPIYVPGRTQQETERLQQQARLFEPFTRRMLEAAGITAGMKVLDVGSKAGDVAFLAADIVGHWFLPLSSLILGAGLLGLFAQLEGRARVLSITSVVFTSIALVCSIGNMIVLSGFFGNIGRSLVFPNNLIGGLSVFTVSIATGFIGGAMLRAHMLHRWMAWTLIVIGIVTAPILLATPLPIGPDWATDTIAFFLSGIGYAVVGMKMLAMDRKAAQQLMSLNATIE